VAPEKMARGSTEGGGEYNSATSIWVSLVGLFSYVCRLFISLFSFVEV